MALPCCRACIHIPCGKDIRECAPVLWATWNSVVREDPQAVIKDLFAGRTWVVLKIDRRLTCPRFQPDGKEQDTRYVETFLYATGDGVCSTSQKNDCQRNAGLHSCSLLCWTTWKHLPLACCTSEFASVQGVRRTVCSVGKHLCSSDQFQEFSYHTLIPPLPATFLLSADWLTVPGIRTNIPCQSRHSSCCTAVHYCPFTWKQIPLTSLI